MSFAQLLSSGQFEKAWASLCLTLLEGRCRVRRSHYMSCAFFQWLEIWVSWMTPVVHHRGTSLGPTASPFLSIAHSLWFMSVYCLYTSEVAVFVFWKLPLLLSLRCTCSDTPWTWHGFWTLREHLAIQRYRLCEFRQVLCSDNMQKISTELG